MNVATTAEAMPTKIEVSDPLIVFFSTSRPHLSPPKGSVASRTRCSAFASTFLSARISDMTSASGSTLFSSAVSGGSGPPGTFPAFSDAMTSPIGSTIFDW